FRSPFLLASAPRLSSDCYVCQLRSVGQRTRRTARQRYTKMTAAALAHHGDAAAVGLDQLARDRQAEAAALDRGVGARLAPGPAAEEKIEDRLALLRRDARAGID